MLDLKDWACYSCCCAIYFDARSEGSSIQFVLDFIYIFLCEIRRVERIIHGVFCIPGEIRRIEHIIHAVVLYILMRDPKDRAYNSWWFLYTYSLARCEGSSILFMLLCYIFRCETLRIIHSMYAASIYLFHIVINDDKTSLKPTLNDRCWRTVAQCFKSTSLSVKQYQWRLFLILGYNLS